MKPHQDAAHLAETEAHSIHALDLGNLDSLKSAGVDMDALLEELRRHQRPGKPIMLTVAGRPVGTLTDAAAFQEIVASRMVRRFVEDESFRDDILQRLADDADAQPWPEDPREL